MTAFYTNNRISVKKTSWFLIAFILLLRTATSSAENSTNELDQAFATDKQKEFDQSIIHYTKALEIQSDGAQGFVARLSRGRAYTQPLPAVLSGRINFSSFTSHFVAG